MTLIKNKTTGKWETVAGGSRTWVGAKVKLLDEVAAGDVGDGTITLCPSDNPPEAGYVQGGSYHHIAGLMSRGVVPADVNIDDMIGPEWVGNWNVKPETLGHKPYMMGSTEYRSNTWRYLEVKYYPSGTEQVMKTYDDVAVSRRFRPTGSGWLNHSDTLLSGHTFGGWYTHYPTGAVIRGEKDYGSGLNGCKVQIGFSYDQPYLIVYNNTNPKVAGVPFVFAQVEKIQQAFWEWGHYPDEYASLCSEGFTNVSGLGLDMCYNAPYESFDSLWLTGNVAVGANELYAKVYANGINR